MNETLTIVGASVRAAAWSALRAGFDVRAGDLFADVDLAERCQATAVADYPRGVEEIIRGSQSGAWFYTGALENHPPLVARWSRLRPLLGNSAAVLRQVRDPFLVARALVAAGLPCPGVTRAPRPPDSGAWVRKPLRSAGGAHIDLWWDGKSAKAGGRSRFYLQQYVEGRSCSGLYLAAGGKARLLGVTRQLIGVGATEAGSFRYSGSIGPISISHDERASWARLGDVLAAEFNLVGLFGVDAIVDAAGVWPVEVNPRYTASAELFDWAQGISTVALHVAACRGGRLPRFDGPAWETAPGSVFGKRIVFASRPLTLWQDLRTISSGRATRDWPAVADIPAPGSYIAMGAPIATVFANGTSEQDVLRQLEDLAARVVDEA